MIQLPAILTRGNILLMSVQTVHSYYTLDEHLTEAEEMERTIVIAPGGDIYRFTPKQAETIVEAFVSKME